MAIGRSESPHGEECESRHVPADVNLPVYDPKHIAHLQEEINWTEEQYTKGSRKVHRWRRYYCVDSWSSFFSS